MLLRRMLAWIVVTTTASLAQNASPPAPVTVPEPSMTQVRKIVTFIKLACRDGDTEYNVTGTGFFVFIPDQRLGKDNGFVYMVTNRHVALCWRSFNQPMEVKTVSITLNRRMPNGGTFSEDIHLSEHGNVPWVTPLDGSVDLAALPYFPDVQKFDVRLLPLATLATSQYLSQQMITEGEPIFFAGFFQQFPGVRRMQPIVRQGIIAMMPDEKIPLVSTPEKLYLADVHVFGGNSGAPAFINLGGFHNGHFMAGEDLHLVGVVNGYVFENEDFTLEIATTFLGAKGKANSGISTIVPADDLIALLQDSRLQAQRDAFVKKNEPNISKAVTPQSK